jgi:hypothetical protein
VPSVFAPNLTTSNETCMGSKSGGVAIAGFGANGGSTYESEFCQRMRMSTHLWNKGKQEASMAVDCMTPFAREALELTGYVCPQTKAAQQRKAEATPLPAPVIATGGNTVVRTVSTPRGWEGANMADPYIARRAN